MQILMVQSEVSKPSKTKHHVAIREEEKIFGTVSHLQNKWIIIRWVYIERDNSVFYKGPMPNFKVETLFLPDKMDP